MRQHAEASILAPYWRIHADLELSTTKRTSDGVRQLRSVPADPITIWHSLDNMGVNQLSERKFPNILTTQEGQRERQGESAPVAGVCALSLWVVWLTGARIGCWVQSSFSQLVKHVIVTDAVEQSENLFCCVFPGQR